MKRLADLKPLERVELPGVGALNPAGLTIVVGPNSSGKTQLLRDIEQRLAGQPRNLVVATTLALTKFDHSQLLECLKSEGYVVEMRQPDGRVLLRSRTTWIGYSQPVLPDIDQLQATQWFDEYRAQPDRTPSQYLNVFGRMLMTSLPLERRLNSLTQVNGFDRNAQAPQSDFHVLYYDNPAQEDLWEETSRAFSKAVWVDATKPNVIRLLVADAPNYPSDKDRRNPSLMDQQREIMAEGDGLKSYVTTAIAILMGRRPICLIDEPELCLHPPQAYSLGRFIGENATSEERATFVATHSSQILRGVIQTADYVQIVRLTRRRGTFQAHAIRPDTLKAITKKPTLRAESLLDGLFADGVVVVEADGDRVLYQAAWETLNDEMQWDIHFAAVGGYGGVVDACTFYRELKIPVVAITDLDVIRDAANLQRIAAALSDKTEATQLGKEAGAFTNKLSSLPPVISSDKVKSQIGEIGSLRMDWNEGDDLTVKRRLQDLASAVDRIRRLKSGGVSATPTELQPELTDLIAHAHAIGLFLVPVGELEHWLANETIAASKAIKWAWAIEAAGRVKERGSQKGDIWDFMRQVGNKLRG